MPSLSPILDVVIGLAGVYIAFSLLASWIQEWVAARMKLRAKGLVTGIYQLFNGNVMVSGSSVFRLARRARLGSGSGGAQRRACSAVRMPQASSRSTKELVLSSASAARRSSP